MNENNPDRFESTVEYQFRNLLFLQEALTHSSFAQESADKPRDNEQMEFLGDAVLTYVVSVVLADAFPEWEEGKLTRARAHLVAAPHLVFRGLRLESWPALAPGSGGGENRWARKARAAG